MKTSPCDNCSNNMLILNHLFQLLTPIFEKTIGINIEHLQIDTPLGIKTSEKMLAHDKSTNCVKGCFKLHTKHVDK